MSKHEHSAEWHVKQVWKILDEIKSLQGHEGVRFALLKRRAARHVERAKALKPELTIVSKQVAAKALNISPEVVNKIKGSQSSPSGGLGVSVPPKPPVDGDGDGKI